jgi:UDP-N-acetylmuramoylalanine--D-glutamate ligase
VELKGRKVLVLGLGDTGMSMARWLVRQGAAVTVADTRERPPHAEQLHRDLPGVRLETGEFRSDVLRAADIIAISPGVDRRVDAINACVQRGMPVIGDIELFAQALEQCAKPPKVMAITGTNGKSTVTRMAGDICAVAGLNPVVAGNIGTPVLNALIEAEDQSASPGAYVLELSSFQLESTESLNADVATMLNLSGDHLDRYADIDEYAAAKSRIFNGSGAQVLNREDEYSRQMVRRDRVVHWFGVAAARGDEDWSVASHDGLQCLVHGSHPVMKLADLPVDGLHNAANALAAGALCSALGVADDDVAVALRAFKGLPHRAEKVAEIEGVVFYDDSKATNVGATVAALTGSQRPVVLIAGGDGKGQDFSALRAPVTAHARAVVLIGRDREQIAQALAASGVRLERAADMPEAVALAHSLSQSGDAVMLSPACASFDMFRNYAHRGDVFASAVRNMVIRDGR